MAKQQRNNFGSVYNVKGRKNKPWRAMITDGYHPETGKPIRKSLGYFETETEANNALLRYAGNPNSIDDRITVKEVYEHWSEEVFHKLSASSKRKYTGVYNKHLTPILNMRMGDIKFHNLNLLLKGKTYPVQYDIKVVLSSMFKWAIPREIVTVNYAASLVLDTTIKAKKLERILFTKEEIQHLWDNVDTIPMADFILILLYTGMRISELLEIKTKDVFLDKNYMLGGNKKYDKEKNLIQRVIPIHPAIRPLIKKRQNNKKYLFNTNRGKPFTYGNFLKTYWNPLYDGIHTCHDTRHTFITKMSEIEARDKYVKLIVGHSLTGITDQVYTHVAPSSLFTEIKKLDYGVDI